jgi:hypothetical protein
LGDYPPDEARFCAMALKEDDYVIAKTRKVRGPLKSNPELTL